MKKKLIILFCIMLVIAITSAFITSFSTQDEEVDNIKIVTSFYPMYILARNIVGDIEGIEILNLTEYETGCLHDYQLTTTDMKKLEGADLFIMNGGGMESFLTDILDSNPELPIINATKGISFLSSEGHAHDHDHEEEDHDHEDNPHVWLNMNHYMEQVQIIQDELSKYDPEHSSIYQENGDHYQEKIASLKQEFRVELLKYEKTPIIIFHDAFAYLAQEFGLEVIHTVNLDGDTHLSAGEIGEVIDKVREHQVKVLFTEEQYSTSIAENIGKETDANVYVIDSIVTGKMEDDAYINAMRYNLEILKQAFEN